MGNCFKKQSQTEWAGEDWASPSQSPELSFSNNLVSKKSYKQNGSATSSGAGVTEVKIKITKKHLEELLGAGDVKGLSVQEMLSRLINGSDRYEAHQRSWKPALQSIPEME